MVRVLGSVGDRKLGAVTQLHSAPVTETGEWTQVNLHFLVWRFAVRHELLLRRTRAFLIGLLARLSVPLSRLPGTSWRFGPPRRTAVDTFEWAATRGLPHREVSPNSLVHRTVDAFGQRLPLEFVVEQTWPIRRDFVVELDEARVWGRNAVPISNDDTLLADMELVATQKPEQLIIKHRLWLGRPERVDGVTTTLVGPFADSYHHWMLDLLPRLDVLDRAGATFDHVLVPPLRPFHRETLERAGIEGDALVVHGRSAYHALERLVLPSLPGQYGQAPLVVCDYLRRLYADEVSSRREDRRLFISRSDDKRRRLLNEDQLLAALESLGFEAVSMAGRTVAEQAELFASAEAVVGPHGGALTNLVFCKEGTKVVELFGPRYTPGCYWAIAESLELSYLPLFQQDDAPHNGAQWTDYTISPARVTAALRHLGVR